MGTIDKVKEWVRTKKENHKSGKWKFFMAAAALILCCGYIWLFHTNVGWIARNSFFKTFDRSPDRIVKVYTGNELIQEYRGAYTIEQYQGYLVLINFEDQTRTNLYGDVIAVVDAPREEQRKKEYMDKAAGYGLNMNFSFVLNDDEKYELGINFEDSEGIKVNQRKSGTADTLVQDVEAVIAEMADQLQSQYNEKEKEKVEENVASVTDALESEVQALKAENAIFNKRIEGLMNSHEKMKSKISRKPESSFSDLIDFLSKF